MTAQGDVRPKFVFLRELGFGGATDSQPRPTREPTSGRPFGARSGYALTMSRLARLLAPLAVGLVAPGCGTFGGDRLRDLDDVLLFSAGAGYGLDSEVRAGPVDLGLGLLAFSSEFGKPTWWTAPRDYREGDLAPPLTLLAGPTMSARYGAGALSIMGMTHVATYANEELANSLDKFLERHTLLGLFEMGDTGARHTPREEFVDRCGLSARAFVGVVGLRVGLNAAELLDFAVGWSGLDLLGDDAVHRVARTALILVHAAAARDLAFSPDGGRVAIVSSAGSAIFDSATGARLHEAPGKHASVAGAPAGGRVARGGDGAVVLRDADTCEVRATLRGHPLLGREVVFAPDGSLLAVEDGASGVTLFDLRGGGAPLRLEVPVPARARPDQPYYSAVAPAWSPDGSRIAIASPSENAVRIVRVADGEVIQSVPTSPGARFEHVQAIAFGADGSSLLACGIGNDVRMWRLDGLPRSETVVVHAGGVRELVVSRDGTVLATTSYDDTVRVWAADRREELLRLPMDDGGGWDLALSPDGRRLASNWPGGAIVWDLSPLLR